MIKFPVYHIKKSLVTNRVYYIFKIDVDGAHRYYVKKHIKDLGCVLKANTKALTKAELRYFENDVAVLTALKG